MPLFSKLPQILKTHGFHVLQNANLCPHKQFKIDHSNCYMVEYVYILYAAPVPFLGGPYAENFTLKRIVCLLAALCLAAGLVGCADMPASSSEESSLPTILVGSDVYPPFNYIGEDGAPTGIDVELAKEAFRRMGYRAEFTIIDWERKTQLLETGDIDCVWGSFTINGREDDYRWAGPYMASRQVVAVMPGSDIETIADLEGRTLAVQSTTKPEELFLTDASLPALRDLYCFEDRELIYTALGKGYVDAIAAHEVSILQYMQDYNTEYRILDEPLQVVRLGVAFGKNDVRGLETQLTATLDEMRADGTLAAIIGKYLANPEKFLEVDGLVE